MAGFLAGVRQLSGNYREIIHPAGNRYPSASKGPLKAKQSSPDGQPSASCTTFNLISFLIVASITNIPSYFISS